VSPTIDTWGYDPDLLAEIVATTDLIIAAAAAPGRLSQDAIDDALDIHHV
jgi:hypothetical protein